MKFEIPELEIIAFEVEDVITTSGTEPTEPEYPEVNEDMGSWS